MIIMNIVAKIISKMVEFLNIKFSMPLWIVMLQIMITIFIAGVYKYSNNKHVNETAFIKEQERAVRFKEFYITNFINITNKLSTDYGLSQQDIIILSNSVIWGKYD